MTEGLVDKSNSLSTGANEMKGAWRIRIKVGDEMVAKNNLEILLK